MKRLLSITLALSLLGSSVAMAHGYQATDRHSYSTASYRDQGDRDRGGNAAAAIGFGALALGLFGALASQHDSYAPAYYAPPAPPPPAYAYPGYGYATPGYGYGFYGR